MMLFDWIYPAYTPILHRAVEIWYQDPQVSYPFIFIINLLKQNSHLY
jgi:exportin-7